MTGLPAQLRAEISLPFLRVSCACVVGEKGKELNNRVVMSGLTAYITSRRESWPPEWRNSLLTLPSGNSISSLDDRYE